MASLDTVVATEMQVTCNKEELAAKVAMVGRAVSARSSVQILGGILLQADESSASLAATDMEISLRVALAAGATAGGSVVVPGRLLVEIVRLLPGATVDIEHKAAEGVVHLRSGPAEYTLHTYNAEDFPRLPEIDKAGLFTVEREGFLDTIRRVSRAASRDESRPVLTGILVRFDEGKVVMAATDSYRLSVKETPIGTGPAGAVEAIVPARALGELQRICHAEGPPIEIGVHENQVVFGADEVWLTARRIDGQFPNYRQLLPETFEAEIQLPRQELADVVRRAKLMVQRNSPVRLRFEQGQLTVSAQTQDVGEAKETMPAAYSGETIEIGFNAEFLLDGLESVMDETVRLKLISPLRPGMIHGESDDFLYLIMPIRLAG